MKTLTTYNDGAYGVFALSPTIHLDVWEGEMSLYVRGEIMAYAALVPQAPDLPALWRVSDGRDTWMRHTDMEAARDLSRIADDYTEADREATLREDAEIEAEMQYLYETFGRAAWPPLYRD